MVCFGCQDPAAIDKMVKQSLAKPKTKPTKHDFYKRFCEKAGVRLASASVCWAVD